MPGWPASLLARWARSRRTGARRRELLVAAPVDEALHASAAALRRLGARLTRYDVDDATLEASLTRWTVPGVVRLRATADSETRTRLTVESDVIDGWIFLAQFQGELSSPREEAP